MGHSTKPQVYRLILLFLVFYNEHLMAVNINVTAGNPVTISFKFNSSICIKGIKYANLNKDGIKIDEWPNTQRHWQVNKTHCTATVSITNATATDAGIYYVSLFPSNSSGRYEESAKETLTVLSAVTGSPATSHVTEAGTSEGSSPTLSAYIKVICAFLITTVVLIILLLSWVFLSRRRSLGKKSQGSSNAKVTYTLPSPASVYSVEYGVLDFPSRPVSQEGIQNSGPAPESRDGVVYSTITFVPLAHQGEAHVQCGAMDREQTPSWCP
ncbi:uncharacterized protein LOC125716803 isoform X2 [Brienomyrus brachyistius]|uniref:uncharacterized protein LOC125716803 isoform X2 n=1 Tax=Brienomyrus brachyistius TaxID=42636 RepID=UPI0020B2E547|nr:uncharacterized protein LOC125716803 isoform X2 [Brienomyrus brachyistius]